MACKISLSLALGDASKAALSREKGSAESERERIESGFSESL
jgi:hypothetical protein